MNDKGNRKGATKEFQAEAADISRPWCTKTPREQIVKQPLLARLRSGYKPLLRGYAHFLDPSDDPA